MATIFTTGVAAEDGRMRQKVDTDVLGDRPIPGAGVTGSNTYFLRMLGAGEYIQTVNPITVGADWTLMLWLNRRDNSSANMTFIEIGNNELEFYYDGGSGAPSGTWALDAKGGGSNGATTVHNERFRWHYIWLVNQSGTISMFIDHDGVSPADEVAATTRVWTSPKHIRIGKRFDGMGSWTGDFDEIRLYSVARTAGAMFSDYDAQISPIATPNLAFYLRLNDNTPLPNPTLLDEPVSGNANLQADGFNGANQFNNGGGLIDPTGDGTLPFA